MARLFEALEVFDHRSTPGLPAQNMAMDEALLLTASLPVLRFYRWREPAVTFGYFLNFGEVAAMAGDRPLMRRWTGGGIVEHGEDFTWSLIVPAACPVHRMRPVASYGAIHAAVAEAMAATGSPVHQVPLDQPSPAGGLCMTAPAPGDLLWNGQKVAGAGQRRSRHGLLHQGTIRGVPLGADFPSCLATTLAGKVLPFPVERQPVAEAEALVASRYGTDEWLRMR